MLISFPPLIITTNGFLGNILSVNGLLRVIFSSSISLNLEWSDVYLTTIFPFSFHLLTEGIHLIIIRDKKHNVGKYIFLIFKF